jgi:hypothetical protein
MPKAKPVRLQLSRKAGFDLQRMSRATNGLDAVVAARPSVWGNPYRARTAAERAAAVQKCGGHIAKAKALQARAKVELRGRNLACWCPLDGPCHADIWLEIANS